MEEVGRTQAGALGKRQPIQLTRCQKARSCGRLCTGSCWTHQSNLRKQLDVHMVHSPVKTPQDNHYAEKTHCALGSGAEGQPSRGC